MLKEAIATGETVERALENACRELEVDRSEAEFEVLEAPVKKILGLFGGSPAKVRAYIEIAEAVEVISVVDKTVLYLKEVLTQMGLSDVGAEVTETEKGADIVLAGSDVGYIIGHRGETLDALQYLASLVANQDGEYFRITLDVGNYREKRKDTLESLGKKMALKSLKTGRNNSLEPMNPYERRLIHTAVQTIDGAKSWSEGSDMDRHVVIGPADGERYSRNKYNRGNRPRQNQGKGRSNQGGYQKNRRPKGNNTTEVPQGVAASVASENRPAAPTGEVYGKISK